MTLSNQYWVTDCCHLKIWIASSTWSPAPPFHRLTSASNGEMGKNIVFIILDCLLFGVLTRVFFSLALVLCVLQGVILLVNLRPYVADDSPGISSFQSLLDQDQTLFFPIIFPHYFPPLFFPIIFPHYFFPLFPPLFSPF